jgi:transglutaminase-like putative cysteine protease
MSPSAPFHSRTPSPSAPAPHAAVHRPGRRWWLVALAACSACAGAADADAAAADQMTATQRLWWRVDQALAAKQFDVAEAEARRLYDANPEPWVQVLVAAATSASGQREAACRELATAIAGIARDPLAAGPMVVDLSDALANDDAWATVRADVRYPDLLAAAQAAKWRPQPLAFDATSSTAAASVTAETATTPATSATAVALATAVAPRTRRPARDDTALRALRGAYGLDAVVAGAGSDLDRVRRMCAWVHGRTRHDGWNADMPTDAKGLLDAAAKGGQWRCVEFGVVVAECLRAIGVPARTVGGRARDVETMLGAAGHVFAEAWLDDRQAWVFVDAQEDLVAVDADGAPLHAAAFRNALARPQAPPDYPLSLAMCLHYLVHTAPAADDAPVQTMLAPLGAPMPTKFQRRPMRAPDVFTHRLADFYAPPGV